MAGNAAGGLVSGLCPRDNGHSLIPADGPDRRVSKQAIRERAAGCGQAASFIMAFIFVSTSSATSARAGEAERAERSLVGNAVAILVWPFSS